MDRTTADYIGMLATVHECYGPTGLFRKQLGVPTSSDRYRNETSCRAIYQKKAVRHLEKGRVVIFGAGTGNPYFSTDTAAALRAAEMEADVILLAKNVDAVYDKDPKDSQ